MFKSKKKSIPMPGFPGFLAYCMITAIIYALIVLSEMAVVPEYFKLGNISVIMLVIDVIIAAVAGWFIYWAIRWDEQKHK